MFLCEDLPFEIFVLFKKRFVNIDRSFGVSFATISFMKIPKTIKRISILKCESRMTIDTQMTNPIDRTFITDKKLCQIHVNIKQVVPRLGPFKKQNFFR